MSGPRVSRRRFLAGAAVLGAGAALASAGGVAIRGAARPAGPDPQAHTSRPILPAPAYITVVEARRTATGVPYLAAVARPRGDGVR
ncbi:MAG: hypothetical protein ABI635_04790 [Actinomycetota bacterium]